MSGFRRVRTVLVAAAAPVVTFRPFRRTSYRLTATSSVAGSQLTRAQVIPIPASGALTEPAPAGTTGGRVTVAGAGTVVVVGVQLSKAAVTRDALVGFAEDAGYVAIEPEHFTKQTECGPNRWVRIADYGRTLSGMRAEAPVDAPATVPGKDSPCLEYRMHLSKAGLAQVTAITAPTLNFIPGRAVRYAVSFDDEEPQIVTLVPAGSRAQNGNHAWEKSVSDNAHQGQSRHAMAASGEHVLKIWMIDPGVVIQKILVDLGGLRPSYLGPPETFRGPAW